ncbi:MAG TPA: hypothetical protein VF100_04815, partial [Thermoanaerobaculia bacterium]
MARAAAVLAVLVALGLLPAAQAPAQCGGYAQSTTTASGSSDCDIIFGSDVPYLKWSFYLLCFDDCGQLWNQYPAQQDQATGACAAIPQTLCVPFFDQRDYNNGLYAVTTSRDQYVAMGCRFGETRYTDGSCPCAPSCAGDEETPMQFYQEPGYGSPVLLSLGDGRHELTSAAEGVLF